MLKIGDTIYDGDKSEYLIKKLIGRGGMGYVLLVERKSDKESFAVKTLSVFIDGDSDHKALINEANLAQTIKHKNVISYIYFHDGDVYPELPPYIIMELAENTTLQDLINERIQLGEFIEQEGLIALYHQLIDGMEAINQKLVHRDIKPANILLIENEIKISDFGIAKISGDSTRSKSFKGSGTPAYFPPEAYWNKPNTILMDIYSMGLVFYYLATLKHPYEINQKLNNEEEWKNAHLSAIPPLAQKINTKLSPKISGVIQKMLEKDPQKRFSTWSQIRSELRSIDGISQSPHSSIIEKIVSKNTQKRFESAQKSAEIEKQKRVEKQRVDMIRYQFFHDIISPIKEFIDSYNLANPLKEDQIKIREEVDNRGYPIKNYSVILSGPDSSYSIDIYLHIIDDSDNIIRNNRDLFEELYIQTITPKLNSKPILAWGAIQERGGKGLNLVLCKLEDNVYGDWSVLENVHNHLGSQNDGRPDPFPFNLDEIKKEISLVGAMHIYHTTISPHSPEKLIGFISEF